MPLEHPEITTVTPTDLLSDRLRREADVFAGGTLSGVGQAITAHPGKDLSEFGAAAGIGMLLTVATNVSKAAMPKLIKEVVGISAMITTFTDVVPRLDIAYETFKRTWQSGAHEDSDRAVIGLTIGKYLVDTVLTSGGGVYGAKFGHNPIFHKALSAPGVRDFVVPTLTGYEKFENKMVATAKNISKPLITPLPELTEFSLPVVDTHRKFEAMTVSSDNILEDVLNGKK